MYIVDKPSIITFIPRIEMRKGFTKAKKEPRNTLRRGRWKQLRQDLQWPIAVTLIGFLLGRAVMLEGMAPFAPAFFGVLLYLRKDQAFWAALAIAAGSFWSLEPMPAVIAAEMGVIYLFYRGLVLYEKADLSHAPVVVFAGTLLVCVFQTVMADAAGWLPYVLAFVEAGLAFVLATLFIHAVSLLTRMGKNAHPRHEEWVGVAILLACLLTGMSGWSVLGVPIVSVCTRFFVLVTAYIGGPAIGALAGVVAGVVVGLSHNGALFEIGLLAFGGLMAGLIREGGKAASIFGMLLGTSVLVLYEGSADGTMTSTWATVAASMFLLALPKKVKDSLSSYMPGTVHYAQNQREYAKKVRDLTAERVERFSEVFRQLSRSFRQITQAGELARQSRDIDHFVDVVQNRVCASCHRRQTCWDSQYFESYKLMTEMMSAIEARAPGKPAHTMKAWNKACIRVPQVMNTLEQQYDVYRHDLHWRQQLQDSRYLVADQLSGVSQVMDDLVKEIRRESRHMEQQEEQIRAALDQLGLAIQRIEIISLEEGHVEIEMVHAFPMGYDECRKMIAPLLSEILEETVSVVREKTGTPAANLTTVTFASAKAFEVETGVAGAAKDGDLLSGDSFSMVELGNGKFAVAISDGMGNGARARMESSAALSMLEQLLQSGIDEQLAIKSVNSVLLLRSPDEMFATIDLALIDLYSAYATLLKIGSTPSFIKRGDEVIPISANNLPVGIVQDIEIDLLRIQLQPEDTLIMMTDGVLDSSGHAVNKELWMKRVLHELEDGEPQQMAEALLEVAMRQYPGSVKDDMTVVVTKLLRHQPEWAAFRWPGFSRMERPRTVS